MSDFQCLPMRIVLVTLVLVALGGPARASEWRYCYALSAAQHRLYMSAAFPAPEPLQAIEAAFTRWLDGSNFVHQAVACPRGSDLSEIQSRMQTATAFNRENGNSVVRLDRPAAEALVTH